MPLKCNCSASPRDRGAVLKGAGLCCPDPDSSPSDQPAGKRENFWQIQAKGLWWAGDKAYDKTQVLVRKSLYFALAIESGQDNSGTSSIQTHPCLLPSLA